MEKSKHNSSVEDGFVYMHVAFGGFNRHNQVVRLDELEPNGHADCYRTFNFHACVEQFSDARAWHFVLVC